MYPTEYVDMQGQKGRVEGHSVSSAGHQELAAQQHHTGLLVESLPRGQLQHQGIPQPMLQLSQSCRNEVRGGDLGLDLKGFHAALNEAAAGAGPLSVGPLSSAFWSGISFVATGDCTNSGIIIL
ncbi:MAG: hypothetical protein FRX49_11829 [Trebouxia sp. A1-2]|nr:MAG: hypothetical protein FRX49_11829 [Trebouxia sp. A1-2]